MSLLRRILREPLLHFLVLGALVFGIYSTFAAPETETSDTRFEVVVTQAQVDGMASRFESTWRRQPNADELRGMIDAHVRQDILVQEALALSMDENDPVIRQRLAQKMEFLVDSAASAQPSNGPELEEFFQENAADYATTELIAFEQVFLGDAPTEDVILQTIEAANAGVDIMTLGQRTMLSSSIRLSDRGAIAQTFGADLFDAVAALETEQWQGPFQSAFGVHVIRLLEHVPSTVPDLQDVRARVEADWLRKASDDLSAALFDQMRKHYTIVLPEGLSEGETDP